MQIVKVIPCLDIKNGRVVKGVKFVNLKDARDPLEAAKAYSAAGADELVFLDIAASVEARATRLDWVKRVKEATTIPFCVGGGIRNLEDMQALFALGVDKVSINTAAVKNPDLIKESVKRFSKEKIVVAIDGKKNPSKSAHPRLEVLIMGGEEDTGLEVVEWAKKVEKLGAGEILLTSKDADGTKQGYDLEMTRAVAEAVNIPVVASGGAGKLEHLYEAVVQGKASAVLAASIFHFGEVSIREAKKYLKKRGIPVRIEAV
jgi:cyclase